MYELIAASCGARFPVTGAMLHLTLPLLLGLLVLARGAATDGELLPPPLRGDNDLIRLGENVNVQDGSVVHTDGGVQVSLGKNVSIGHV